MATPRDTYSHGHQESVLRSHRRRTAENSAGYLLAHLRPDQSLLDVGVGAGTITCDLAERLSRGSVIGIDNAHTAVSATRELAAARSITNLQTRLADVYALDFDDDAFDVVHAHQVVQHLSDPVAALREMRRVCRPDGIVAVRDADYAAMTWFPASPVLTRWMQIYQAVARGNQAEPDAGRRLKSWSEQAGLVDVRCTASTWCYSTEADLGWWCDTWADRLLESDFAAQATARGLIDTPGLSRLSDGWRRWATEPGAWFTVLHGEVLGHP